jgi:hypothetical protein
VVAVVAVCGEMTAASRKARRCLFLPFQLWWEGAYYTGFLLRSVSIFFPIDKIRQGDILITPKFNNKSAIFSKQCSERSYLT